MFVCSRRSVVLDHFRVPYDVVPEPPEESPAWVSLAPRADAARALRWPAFDGASTPSKASGTAPAAGRLRPMSCATAFRCVESMPNFAKSAGFTFIAK